MARSTPDMFREDEARELVADRVKPYMRELAPLVAELRRALAAGSFDESTFDLHAAIFG